MNYYYLGWESREVSSGRALISSIPYQLLQLHKAFSKTDLLALELNNLKPHVDGGGAYFMKMTQQLN